jgi:5-methylcytosine-specific restriction endonuclease McrA
MSDYRLTHLGDEALLRGLDDLAAQDRTTTANLLAHMAEVDFRRLYAPAGYSSMHAYCTDRLKLSDDAAFKRLQVARQARRFPHVYFALADGRVHLSGLVLLAPHLTPENVDDLIARATYRRKFEIATLVASLFPSVEALRLDDGVSALPSRVSSLAPGQVETANILPSDPVHVPSPAPGQVMRRERIVPVSDQRFSFEITIDRETHDLLRKAQDLLGHAGSSRDAAEVVRRGLQALVAQLEKRKHARVERPRRARTATRARTIPAEVRRAVWERDGGRCTFVGAGGHACGSTKRLQFDHVIPMSRGGESTAENIRLLCPTHNRLEAEIVFGRRFMELRRGASAP